MPCPYDEEILNRNGPDPAPKILGAMDTTFLGSRFGNIGMWGTPQSPDSGKTCCGWRPHFNWIISTCTHDPGSGEGQFCRGLPEACKDNVHINYVAAYQYDGEDFVLMQESSCGHIDETGGVGGAYPNGFEESKKDFLWVPGDWTTKYSPHCESGEGFKGPRGGTPPAMMFVLSADRFYYGGFYFLSQYCINLQKHGTGSCWAWEFDAVEGTVGWGRPPVGTPAPTPGVAKLNQLYVTNNAQVSGSMPVMYTAAQMNRGGDTPYYPEAFRDICKKYPKSTGCENPQPDKGMSWSGGRGSASRFKNAWGKPYIFIVVIDKNGYWTYRYIPGADGKIPWKGITLNKADKKVVRNPPKIVDPRGLSCDVGEDVPGAVLLLPSLPPSASCHRSAIEVVNWDWGSAALGSIAYELGNLGTDPSSQFYGAHNWWAHFQDTGQYQDYPASIMGGPKPPDPTGPCSSVETTKECPCPSNDPARTGKGFIDGRKEWSRVESPWGFTGAGMLCS